MPKDEQRSVEDVVLVRADTHPTRREAEIHLGAAWSLLADDDKFDAAWELLKEAERFEMWKPLRFASWRDCLVQTIPTLPRLGAQARTELSIELRSGDSMATREIARLLGVAPSTTVRDLQVARDAGRTVEGLHRPERMKPRGPKQRATGLPRTAARRPDLLRSWRNAVDDLTRRTKTLTELSIDSRYRERRADLATSTRADLMRAYHVLGAVLADFNADHSGDPIDTQPDENPTTSHKDGNN